MMRLRRIAVILAVIGLGFSVVLATDLFRSLSTNLRIYNNIVRHLLAEYVDDINDEDLIEASIQGMLEDLDPYTVYIQEEDQMSVGMLTRGKYGGVGIRLGVRGDTLTVIAPMEDTPAYRAGIRPGDKIIAIDHESALDLRTDDAAQKIRGKPGTEVILTFRRYGEKEPFDITLVREEIKVNDLPYYGVDNGIGYIRVSRFSRDAAKEVRNAISELQDQQIGGLVIDLRDNPGGLLQDAVVMVDALVEPGLSIVETRGRTKKATRTYMSENEPALEAATPLIILVNEGSASASEIVAGAIQDLDRGVIIGERTFGKGLVQSIFPVGKNTSLKVTTAKYYIPSGRLIQKEDYLENGVLTDGLDKKDSLFVTRSGRIVQGGGGILPDIELEDMALTPLASRLFSRSLYFAFATLHQNDYDVSLPVVITDEIMEDFRAFVASKELDVTFPGEKDMENFEASLEKLDSFEGGVDLGELKAYFESRERTSFDDEYDQIKRLLKLEFASIKGGIGERIHSALEDDPGYLKAVEIMQSPLAYQEILRPEGQTAHKN
ncbi:MAG: S41 family peptidase [Fidelibacterota bacterium]|nr:MAG: S41 family peptidase [Candidatus Neomarinimicrobiota bacterium]